MIRKFLGNTSAASAVEYAVMLSLIIVVVYTAVAAIGTNSKGTFNSVANVLTSST